MKSSMRFSLLVSSLLLFVLQFLVYIPVLNNSFVHYDDNTYVYENKNIKVLNAQTISGMFARPYFRSYTPVALLSHGLDYALWKDNPRGHHLTSVVLHGMNVVLVFLLAVALLSKVTNKGAPRNEQGLFSHLTPGVVAGACAGALLYALHPMRVESVAWVSDRKDLLLALFLLPSILAYLKYDETRGSRVSVRWFLLAIAFDLLALLSKSIATVTPLLLLLLDGLLLHRGATRAEWKTLLLEKLPFFLLSLGFGLLAMWSAHGSLTASIVAEMTATQRMLLPLYTVAFYPMKYLVPISVTPIYDSVTAEWMAVGAFFTFVLIAGSLWLARKGRTGWLLAFAAYVIVLLPTITGLSAGIQPWADRYTYVPSIAFFILIGGGISLLWDRTKSHWRNGIVGAVLLLAAFFALMDRQGITVWKDSESLWRKAILEAPMVPMAYDNLGVALADKGDFDGALEMYRMANRLEATFADPYFNAAVAFQAKEMRDSAFIYYTRAVSADPGYTDAYINLANMLASEGNRDGAIGLYRRALLIEGDNADAYYNLGCVLFLNGERDRASEAFRKAITFSPNYANAYYNLGVVLLDSEKKDSALECFARAARLGSREAQNTLVRQGYSW